MAFVPNRQLLQLQLEKDRNTLRKLYRPDYRIKGNKGRLIYLLKQRVNAVERALKGKVNKLALQLEPQLVKQYEQQLTKQQAQQKAQELAITNLQRANQVGAAIRQVQQSFKNPLTTRQTINNAIGNNLKLQKAINQIRDRELQKLFKARDLARIKNANDVARILKVNPNLPSNQLLNSIKARVNKKNLLPTVTIAGETIRPRTAKESSFLQALSSSRQKR